MGQSVGKINERVSDDRRGLEQSQVTEGHRAGHKRCLTENTSKGSVLLIPSDSSNKYTASFLKTVTNMESKTYMIGQLQNEHGRTSNCWN